VTVRPCDRSSNGPMVRRFDTGLASSPEDSYCDLSHGHPCKRNYYESESIKTPVQVKYMARARSTRSASEHSSKYKGAGSAAKQWSKGHCDIEGPSSVFVGGIF
jgi:hypothetical protein